MLVCNNCGTLLTTLNQLEQIHPQFFKILHGINLVCEPCEVEVKQTNYFTGGFKHLD